MLFSSPVLAKVFTLFFLISFTELLLSFVGDTLSLAVLLSPEDISLSLGFLLSSDGVSLSFGFLLSSDGVSYPLSSIGVGWTFLL